jgi:hypothetical protein
MEEIQESEQTTLEKLEKLEINTAEVENPDQVEKSEDQVEAEVELETSVDDDKHRMIILTLLKLEENKTLEYFKSIEHNNNYGKFTLDDFYFKDTSLKTPFFNDIPHFNNNNNYKKGVFTKKNITKGDILFNDDSMFIEFINDANMDLTLLIEATSSKMFYLNSNLLRERYFDNNNVTEKVNVMIVNINGIDHVQAIKDIPENTELFMYYTWYIWVFELLNMITMRNFGGYIKMVQDCQTLSHGLPSHAMFNHFYRDLLSLIYNDDKEHEFSLERYNLLFQKFENKSESNSGLYIRDLFLVKVSEKSAITNLSAITE